MLLCEISMTFEINDLLTDICLCPLEIDYGETYLMFGETVRPSALELIRNAA